MPLKFLIPLQLSTRRSVFGIISVVFTLTDWRLFLATLDTGACGSLDSASVIQLVRCLEFLGLLLDLAILLGSLEGTSVLVGLLVLVVLDLLARMLFIISDESPCLTLLAFLGLNNSKPFVELNQVNNIDDINVVWVYITLFSIRQLYCLLVRGLLLSFLIVFISTGLIENTVIFVCIIILLVTIVFIETHTADINVFIVNGLELS